jgi:hypothetical protein
MHSNRKVEYLQLVQLRGFIKSSQDCSTSVTGIYQVEKLMLLHDAVLIIQNFLQKYLTFYDEISLKVEYMTLP